jgi:hypothetical protein
MRYFRWLAAGIGLFGLSQLLESMGDLAPIAASGVSWERATWHIPALLVLLAGLACFVRAGVLIWRSLSGGGSSPPSATEQARGGGGECRGPAISTPMPRLLATSTRRMPNRA